jgi:hypothetical protein
VIPDPTFVNLETNAVRQHAAGPLRFRGAFECADCAGRKRMDRACRVIMAASVVICAATARVEAAPPTVTPSPGYDARLQEQRAAAAKSATAPVVPVRPAYRRHRAKHVHDR